MSISFPSTEYFEALKAQMAANEEKFRRLGFIDTTFGVSVGVNGKARNFAFFTFSLGAGVIPRDGVDAARHAGDYS
jgi:hypothetical protein